MSSFLSFFHSLIKNGTIPLKAYSVSIEYVNSNNNKLSHGHKVRMDSIFAYDRLFDAVNDDIIEDNDYLRFSGLNILFIIKRISGKWVLDFYKTWPNYFNYSHPEFNTVTCNPNHNTTPDENYEESESGSESTGS